MLKIDINIISGMSANITVDLAMEKNVRIHQKF